MTEGTSRKPLVKTLGLRDGQRVWFSGMPEGVYDEIDEYALELIPVRDPSDGVDAAHVFVSARGELVSALESLRPSLAPDGQVWVSWPNEASGVQTDLTEDAIREIADPLGFVDTKACAIDEAWSGLKLVIRKNLR